jgi:hypothetical protein
MKRRFGCGDECGTLGSNMDRQPDPGHTAVVGGACVQRETVMGAHRTGVQHCGPRQRSFQFWRTGS